MDHLSCFASVASDRFQSLYSTSSARLATHHLVNSFLQHTPHLIKGKKGGNKTAKLCILDKEQISLDKNCVTARLF